MRRAVFIALVLIGVLLLAGVLLIAFDDAFRVALRDRLQQEALELSHAGNGYQDGALVFSQERPFRITLEELPSLEGRLRGTRLQAEPLLVSMSWFGVSLRATVARCLHVPERRVAGDPSLDGIWLDVDAARPTSPFAPAREGWEPVEQAILAAVLDTYGLGLTTEEREEPVVVLQAGQGWEAHVLPPGRPMTTVASQDGSLTLQGGQARHLLDLARRTLEVEVIEGVDADAPCDVDLAWTPGDDASLRQALAEQLDLHVRREPRPLLWATVEGVATAHAAAAADAPTNGTPATAPGEAAALPAAASAASPGGSSAALPDGASAGDH